MGCGCDGAGAATPAAAGAAATFTIRLHNGTKVGSFPTRSAAETALVTAYNGQGTVVAK